MEILGYSNKKEEVGVGFKIDVIVWKSGLLRETGIHPAEL